MADVEFIDYSAEVKKGMEAALIAGLEEAAGEIEAMTIRNSRQGHKYGGTYATELWEHQVDEDKFQAYVGSPHEAGYWEEFGTGEHALNGDGRKGWWVYIEGGSGYQGKTNTYNSRDEAERAAKFIEEEYGVTAHATDGIEPNRPLHRAFQSGASIVQAILDSKLKGMG